MAPIKSTGPSQQDLLRHQAAKRLLANGTVKSFEDLPPALQRGSMNVSKAAKGAERTRRERQNELGARQKIEDNRRRSTTTAQLDEQSLRVSARVNAQVKENKKILQAAAHDKNPVIRGIAKATDACTYSLAEKTNDAMGVASDYYRAGMQDSFSKGKTGAGIVHYAGNALVQMGDGLLGYNRVLDHRSTVQETRSGLVTVTTNLAAGGASKMLGKGLTLTESQAANLAKLNRPIFQRAPKTPVTPAASKVAAAPAAARAKPGVRDWVRSNGDPKKWTPELTREHYLATAPKKAAQEMSKVNAGELRAMYPEGGPIPGSVNDLAATKGFGELAKSNPAKARSLAEANTVFGDVVDESRKAVKQSLLEARAAAGRPLTEAERSAARLRGMERAADHFEPMRPIVRQHPTDARYLVVERGPKSPSFIPERQLHPKSALDHNGAFQQSAAVKGRLYGERTVPAQAPQVHAMGPSALKAQNMDGVMVFSAHGAPTGFAGLSTKQAAQLVATEIKAAKRPIDQVVLDACHQRDVANLRWESNAQVFERELNQALKAQNHPPVTVLAAERGGPTYGFGQRAYLPTLHREGEKTVFRGKWTPTNYTPAADGARLYVDPTLAAGTGTIAGGAGYAVYRANQR